MSTDDKQAIAPQGEFVLFQSADGSMRVECRFESDTLWLTQSLMAELYQKNVRTINEHLQNIYKEGELARHLRYILSLDIHVQRLTPLRRLN